MARDWTITRTEAENLVDLLEDCDQKIVGTWRHDLAAELRDLFGMISLEEEKKNKVMGIKELKKRGFPVAYMYGDKRLEDLTHEELLEAYKELAEDLESESHRANANRRILSAVTQNYRNLSAH